MPRTPLFSTYRQGENRVTGSMLAVFERIGLDSVEQLLAAASGESSLGMVTFANQVARTPGTVPDAAISASFHYLFEVKVKANAVDAAQLRRHLTNFQVSSDAPRVDQRLFVISPDPVEPSIIGAVGDPRVQWFSFADLSAAITTLVDEPRSIVSEQERFLLHELQVLLEEEGLLSFDDVVVVAARAAYPEYRARSAYICQSNRSFQAGVKFMGFYTAGAIQPLVPQIIARADNVQIDQDEARLRAASADPADHEIAEIVERLVADGSPRVGGTSQIFVLSAPDDERTLRLSAPVRNVLVGRGGRPFAWTLGQRYTRSETLIAATTTADLEH